MVTIHGYHFALRGGIDNLTNQANPSAVDNVTGVPQFLQFLGAEGRYFVVRYEIGANIGYGFYRNGTIFSDSGTAGDPFGRPASR
jgi:hypothetical protein